jgi:hypothetical protein
MRASIVAGIFGSPALVGEPEPVKIGEVSGMDPTDG